VPFNTFTPPQNPSEPITDKKELATAAARFGDGYEQRTAKGINYARSVLDIRWDVLTTADADTIENFFLSQQFQPFYYQLPSESSARKWVVTEWQRTDSAANIAGIKATFRESFEIDN
jgi:phage-related protein